MTAERVIKRESGQAMAEFALVLPILALLTFGTIEVAIYLQQQSAINAAAYLTARSASVVANSAGPTQEAAKSFAAATGYGWLASASLKNASKADTSSYTLTAGADRFGGLISGITGNQVKGFDKMAANVTLPLEYDAKRANSRPSSITHRPDILFAVDYDSKFKAPDVLKAERAKLSLELLKKAFAFKPQPTPAPSAKPTPKPAPGASPKPQPKPQPSAKPSPAVDLSKFAASVQKLQAAPEPFNLRGAVQPNPHNRGSGNQSIGGGTSKHYIHPQYEADSKPADKYKIADILKDFDTYRQALDGDKASVETGTMLLGQLARQPAYKPVLALIGNSGSELAQTAEKAYEAEKKDATRRRLAGGK